MSHSPLQEVSKEEFIEGLKMSKARDADIAEQYDTPEMRPEEAAFLESDSMYWGERKLHPFSARRQAAAELLGLKWGLLSADEMRAFRETGRYPGLANDAAVVIFLCLADKESVRRVFSSRRREEFISEMEDWADQENIGMIGNKAMQAGALMVKILQQVITSSSEPDLPAGKHSKN